MNTGNPPHLNRELYGLSHSAMISFQIRRLAAPCSPSGLSLIRFPRGIVTLGVRRCGRIRLTGVALAWTCRNAGEVVFWGSGAESDRPPPEEGIVVGMPAPSLILEGR
jgi:hypothetical protein